MHFLVMLYGDEGAGDTPARLTPEQAGAWAGYERGAREQGVFVETVALEPSTAARSCAWRTARS